MRRNKETEIRYPDEEGAVVFIVMRDISPAKTEKKEVDDLLRDAGEVRQETGSDKMGKAREREGNSMWSPRSS